MRHAKSDWSGENLSDHDRPLNDRGLRDAPTMARWIVEWTFLPDLILCSSATRTQQTAMMMQSYWKNIGREPAQVLVIEDLYLATANTIFQTIQAVAPRHATASTVLLLAHNPGISHAAAELVGYPIELPTAAVAVLQCEISSWSKPLSSENTKLISEMKPKSLVGKNH
jgi:phosphohistidine phosphatase